MYKYKLKTLLPPKSHTSLEYVLKHVCFSLIHFIYQLSQHVLLSTASSICSRLMAPKGTDILFVFFSKLLKMILS